VSGKVIAYSTTNGTQAIALVSSVRNVLIGAFSNLTAISHYLIQHPRPVLLLCSGWKNKFNLEDTLCAGAIANKLLQSGAYSTNCDSTHAAIDLWQLAKNDLMKYLEKASHRHRLKTIVDETLLSIVFRFM
jgi:2-phosphosulfolactate phosphatase